MDKFRTITVGQLRDLLDGEDDDKLVIFTADYGDYHHTAQALPLIGEADEALIRPSAYSNSGFALIEDDEDEGQDRDETFLLIR